MRRTLAIAALCIAAWLLQAGLAGYLSRHDVIAALLVQRDTTAAIIVASVLVLRLFLLLLAPGWLLWLVVAGVESRLRTRSVQSSSTVPDKTA